MDDPSRMYHPSPQRNLIPQHQQPPIVQNGSSTEVPMMTSDEEKTCPVCKFSSDQVLQIHYGGPACFSCRAFFRRAHQKTKNPNFLCKRGNSCEVTVKTRRRCQKCRYELCLRNGMRPEAVLTQDQRKVRFRNAIKKKEAKSTQNISKEFIDDDDDDDDDDNDDNDDASAAHSHQQPMFSQQSVDPYTFSTPNPSPSIESPSTSTENLILQPHWKKRKRLLEHDFSIPETAFDFVTEDSTPKASTMEETESKRLKIEAHDQIVKEEHQDIKDEHQDIKDEPRDKVSTDEFKVCTEESNLEESDEDPGVVRITAFPLFKS